MIENKKTKNFEYKFNVKKKQKNLLTLLMSRKKKQIEALYLFIVMKSSITYK